MGIGLSFIGATVCFVIAYALYKSIQKDKVRELERAKEIENIIFGIIATTPSPRSASRTTPRMSDAVPQTTTKATIKTPSEAIGLLTKMSISELIHRRGLTPYTPQNWGNLEHVLGFEKYVGNLRDNERYQQDIIQRKYGDAFDENNLPEEWMEHYNMWMDYADIGDFVWDVRQALFRERYNI